MMTRPNITLSAHHCEFETQEEFDIWTAYVAANLADVCGFTVSVSSAEFTGRGALLGSDVICDATDEQTERIEEAMRTLWDLLLGTPASRPDLAGELVATVADD